MLFQVNPLSLGKMERSSKHRKMKAMIRSWCLKVLITLKCKSKCIISNNNRPTTSNNLTSSSSLPTIQTATARNSILQGSVVANKLTSQIQQNQSEALLIRAKTVTWLWVNQPVPESMLPIRLLIQGKLDTMTTRKNTLSHSIISTLTKTTHTLTRYSNLWQRADMATLSNPTSRISKRVKTATMVRMTAVTLLPTLMITAVMKTIAVMKAVSQTTILVKKLELISTTKQMLITITTSNTMLKGIIQISNCMPRVHSTTKSSSSSKTHKVTTNNNKLNTKTMPFSQTMFSPSLLSKFINSNSSIDSKLNHNMCSQTTNSSTHNSISGTKSDKAATMSLRSRARNE